jgi:hypothetical protein
MMENKHGYTLKDILKLIDETDTLTEQEKIEAKVKSFYKFIKWTEKDYEQYEQLLVDLKKANRKSIKKQLTSDEETIKTKDKGDALENIVNFIINKSFFLKVYPNKRTSTNEIDQFVVLSSNGKQAMYEYNFSSDLLGFKDGYFIGECKNYDDNVAATWVGKFYTLLRTCGNCELGIIFSYYGLTGQENNWYDAHGLTKVIYRMETGTKKNHILDFNKEDFEKLRDRKMNFFDIIHAKKNALISGSKSTNFHDEVHDGGKEMKKIYDDQLAIDNKQ